jgi:16S rRNA processing protein RimM
MPLSPLDLDPVALPADAVEVGRISDAWGVQGWFKVHAHSASPEALFSAKRWFIAEPIHAAKGQQAKGWPPRKLHILQAKLHGDGVVAKAEETPDRSTAELFKGWRILVPRSSFPTPAAGEFYWVDLMGLRIINRQNQCLGTVTDLMSTGPQTVLVVTPEAASVEGGSVDKPATLLIPFVDAFIDEVRIQDACIQVDWQADY